MRKLVFIVFLSSFLFCIPFSFHAFSDETLVLDTNQNGIPDQWIEMEGDDLKTIKADVNEDGVIDYEALYALHNVMVNESYDFNYDGSLDDFYYYNYDGILIKREIDSNYDGRVDIWVFITNGIYVSRYEQDLDFDGRIDTVREF